MAVLGPNGAGQDDDAAHAARHHRARWWRPHRAGSCQPGEASDDIGYLPEERGLYPAMKARDAIAFLGALRGLDRKAGRIRAAEMMEAVGLGHAIDEKIRKLSKGMAQLVQLLGSVVHRPALLVLDEPFSGLDPVNQEKLEALILAERDRGATVLFSTHIMAHAERICDRLAIIAGGKRRFEGTVGDARAMLPQRVLYTPQDGGDAVAAALPADAVRDGAVWRFELPPGGIEPLLATVDRSRPRYRGSVDRAARAARCVRQHRRP